MGRDGKPNPARDKSYEFALRIIKLCKYLKSERKEYILSKQILRSGTSIGANVEEALGGQSRRDFLAKISIAYKETRETHYWLRLLTDSNFLNKDAAKPLLGDCEELLRILGSIQKTTKSN